MLVCIAMWSVTEMQCIDSWLFFLYIGGGYCERLKNNINLRVMIHYHLNIQLFTTLSMWQGGPSP
jgi:hypothetical protein